MRLLKLVIFLVVILILLDVFFRFFLGTPISYIPHFFLKSQEGEGCGGFTFNPKECSLGYECVYDSGIIDAPGRCTKIIIGKTFTVYDGTELYYPDEGLIVRVSNLRSECERENPGINKVGCEQILKIPQTAGWEVDLEKNGRRESFTILFSDSDNIQKHAIGYILNFKKLDLMRMEIIVQK